MGIIVRRTHVFCALGIHAILFMCTDNIEAFILTPMQDSYKYKCFSSARLPMYSSLHTSAILYPFQTKTCLNCAGVTRRDGTSVSSKRK